MSEPNRARREAGDEHNTRLLALVRSDAVTPEALSAALDAGADANAKEAAGTTALMVLCNNKAVTPELLSALLATGADASAKAANGTTALMLLCRAAARAPRGRRRREREGRGWRDGPHASLRS